MNARQGSFLLLAALVLAVPQSRAIDLLENDWADALNQARESGKHLYVAFLGEGWSLSCKRYQKQILDSPEFRALASDRLLYCPVSARGEKALSKKAAARLQALVIHFDIKSYPTLILIAPDGREILRHGYREDAPADYVNLLKAILPQPEASGEMKET